MTLGKLCLAACLGAIPAVASAQSVGVGVDVGVNVGVDTYDSEAPGAPVESADVFYDQLEPYGTWVDEPDVGRVYIPDTQDYVPYRTGHWQYTNLGFVWVSNEPHAWATSHYGRWAYSNHYGRWYWLPDTTWGPAWVEWRQTGTHYGWAPLAPEIVIRAGWHPPVESWHYCGAEHVLDPNVVRFYEPRERVVEIHRGARPLEHYATVSRARVVVGPPAAALREHRVAVHPVRCEARTVGRWTPAEAHAQVERARDHRAAFEAQNQHRIDGNARIHAAHVKVIETHPQIKAEVNARVEITRHPGEDHGGPRPGEHGITPREPKPPEAVTSAVKAAADKASALALRMSRQEPLGFAGAPLEEDPDPLLARARSVYLAVGALSAAPTMQQQQSLDEVARQVDEAAKEANVLISENVPALNRLLSDNGMGRIEAGKPVE